MWEIPNIQQSGFVRNGFHMCSWRVSERVRGKGQGGDELGGDGKFSRMTCIESLVRWFRLTLLPLSHFPLHCLVEMHLECYPVIWPNQVSLSLLIPQQF